MCSSYILKLFALQNFYQACNIELKKQDLDHKFLIDIKRAADLIKKTVISLYSVSLSSYFILLAKLKIIIF